jgi:hypothetical protein
MPRWNFTDFMHSFMIVFRVLCGEWIGMLLIRYTKYSSSVLPGSRIVAIYDRVQGALRGVDRYNMPQLIRYTKY